MLSLCVFLMGSAHVCYADDLTDTEIYFLRQEAYCGTVEVPGRGSMRYYAQNEPLWGGLVYEKSTVTSRRPFRDSACGPTACAMAVASLVPAEELRAISQYALRPYSLCPCSLSKAKCDRHHARYYLTSDLDYLRFLPLVFGDFAAGNNTFGIYSRANTIGTTPGFFHQIAQVYGLKLTVTTDYRQAADALKAGSAVVATAGRGGAFTNTGHYVLLAGMDAERLYILDPLWRETYQTNQARKLEILQPGLTALTHENISAAYLGSYYIFSRDIAP